MRFFEQMSRVGVLVGLAPLFFGTASAAQRLTVQCMVEEYVPGTPQVPAHTDTVSRPLIIDAYDLKSQPRDLAHHATLSYVDPSGAKRELALVVSIEPQPRTPNLFLMYVAYGEFAPAGASGKGARLLNATDSLLYAYADPSQPSMLYTGRSQLLRDASSAAELRGMMGGVLVDWSPRNYLMCISRPGL